MAIRSPFAATRNALCHAQYVPAMRSRHGSFVSSVSRTSVSQRSTSCSRRMPVAWSSFSCTRVCWVAKGRRLAGDTMFAWRRGRVVRQRPAKPRTAVRVRSSPLVALLLALVVAGCGAGLRSARRARSGAARARSLGSPRRLQPRPGGVVPSSDVERVLADPWPASSAETHHARAHLRLPGGVHEPSGCQNIRVQRGASTGRARPLARSIGCGRPERRLRRRDRGERHPLPVAEIGEETHAHRFDVGPAQYLGVSVALSQRSSRRASPPASPRRP